jgi:hypothetical protein
MTNEVNFINHLSTCCTLVSVSPMQTKDKNVLLECIINKSLHSPQTNNYKIDPDKIIAA